MDTALQSLFAYKAWANRELFALLQSLDAQAHKEPLHMMVRTLNHIYVVDRIFRAHLVAESHGYSATNTELTPTLDALHMEVSETDAWFEHYVAHAQEDALTQIRSFRFTDGDAGQMSTREMLHHVLAHGAYHRGNLGQQLKNIGLAPPRDLYTKFLHVSEPARRAP